MANHQSLVKGATQLYGRVFNHHAILQSDINTMRNFDGNTQPCEKSAQVLQDQLTQTSEAFSRCDKELPTLSAVSSSLVTAKQICDTILLQSETHLKPEYLANEREARAEKWERFMNEMKSKALELDDKYCRESEAMSNYYKEANEKLKDSNML
ncbi:hypothetical protein EB796_001323 [Bugula neritina]|nr:hypothetical protein EB796_001323 [Bugula neritina]